VGFVDGEGCFFVSKKKECIFQVSNTNKVIIEAIYAYFKVGYIFVRKDKRPNRKPLYSFNVHNPLEFPRIIKFFDKYPPIVKLRDYLRFKEFALKMKPRPRYKKEILEKVKVLYLQGLPSQKIAEMLKLKNSQVEYIEWRLHLVKRSDYWSKADKKKVCQLYKEGHKMREIGEMFGRSVASINHVIQRNTDYRKRRRKT